MKNYPTITFQLRYGFNRGVTPHTRARMHTSLACCNYLYGSKSCLASLSNDSSSCNGGSCVLQEMLPVSARLASLHSCLYTVDPPPNREKDISQRSTTKQPLAKTCGIIRESAGKAQNFYLFCWEGGISHFTRRGLLGDICMQLNPWRTNKGVREQYKKGRASKTKGLKCFPKIIRPDRREANRLIVSFYRKKYLAEVFR